MNFIQKIEHIVPIFKQLSSLQVIGELITSTNHYINIQLAYGGSKQFPALRFGWVVITTLYHLVLQSWHQKTTQSLVNMLVSFSWHNRLPWQQYDLLKTALITALGAYNSKKAPWNFFILSTFDRYDKTQLLAKFKKILYMGFRATLNFRKLKVALNPMYRTFLNFAKSCVLSCLWKVDNIKKFHGAVFEL